MAALQKGLVCFQVKPALRRDDGVLARVDHADILHDGAAQADVLQRLGDFLPADKVKIGIEHVGVGLVFFDPRGVVQQLAHRAGGLPHIVQLCADFFCLQSPLLFGGAGALLVGRAGQQQDADKDHGGKNGRVGQKIALKTLGVQNRTVHKGGSFPRMSKFRHYAQYTTAARRFPARQTPKRPRGVALKFLRGLL